jgi:hypothetical protein
MTLKQILLTALTITALSTGAQAAAFVTRHAALQIDGNGFITSITSLGTNKEYCPAARPSPLMSLHEGGQTNDTLLAPTNAVFRPVEKEIELSYANGAVAVIKAEEKDSYFRFQLVSLTPRGTVDNIVWGPINTTISKLIGDIIGVVRDDDWAIGLYGIDDNTIAGPLTEGDSYGMGYYIHSPDPVKYPLPPQFTEGQWFNIGGDGVNDVAFYSHPEEYFRQVFGAGAKLEPAFGSTIAYHSRDRRKSYTYKYSLLPGFAASRPRTMTSDPVPGVDFIGSAVALYACPDDQGLKTIESIIIAEGLPHYTVDGKWIRDPASFRPTAYWSGSRDKCIEYTKALGIKDISQDTGEFYPNLGNNWTIGNVSFSSGTNMPFKDFTAAAHAQGLNNGGLHTLSLFLQGGLSGDVTPVPSAHLQTVCRTTLATNISATATTIEVTDPSFLAEVGTWPKGDDSNYLRVGGEMMRYSGISTNAPWIIQISKRGHASTAQAHSAGDELVKLQQNCYNGFVPDLTRMLDYADYYADLMFRNGMDTIGFDGFESTVYLNHGAYGTRLFCKRFFETYAALTGGRFPRVSGSCIFSGAWEYWNVCDVGGGDNMFNAASGRRAIEGKDIGNGFSSSYFPATFGGQSWHSDWSLYDAENLQAKAIGWEATYGFYLSQAAIDSSGEKDAIFEAFPAWQNARVLGLFSKAIRERLKDPDFKFHLEQTGQESFLLYQGKQLQLSATANGTPVTLTNLYAAQSLQMAIRMHGSSSALAAGIVITLPDGRQITTSQSVNDGGFIIIKRKSGAGISVTLPDGSPVKTRPVIKDGKVVYTHGDTAYLADSNRKKTANLKLDQPAVLPAGAANFSVTAPAGVSYDLTVWAFGSPEKLGQ